jgi:hypothetical protein
MLEVLVAESNDRTVIYVNFNLGYIYIKGEGKRTTIFDHPREIFKDLLVSMLSNNIVQSVICALNFYHH